MTFAKKYSTAAKKIQAEDKLYDNSKPRQESEYDRVATWTQEAWGNHVLEVEKVKFYNMGDTIYEKEDGSPVLAPHDKIVVELKVVESDTLDEGTGMVWTDNAGKFPESFTKNCLALVSAVTKAPIREVDPADVDLIASDDQPVTGALVKATIEQFRNYRTGELAFTASGAPRTRCTFNAYFGEE